MGFTPRVSTGGIAAFLGISKGMFYQTVDANTEGAVARVNKMGKTVYEKWFDNAFTARIIAVNIKKNNYDGGDELYITLEDGDMIRWILQFAMDSAYGRTFMGTFWKIKPEDEIVIEPWYYIPKQNNPERKYSSGMTIYQYGAKVERFFTQENLSNVPPLVDTIFNGKPAKDNTQQMLYLKKLLQYWVSQRLPAQATPVIVEQQQSYQQPAPQAQPQQRVQQMPIASHVQGYAQQSEPQQPRTQLPPPTQQFAPPQQVQQQQFVPPVAQPMAQELPPSFSTASQPTHPRAEVGRPAITSGFDHSFPDGDDDDDSKLPF